GSRHGPARSSRGGGSALSNARGTGGSGGPTERRRGTARGAPRAGPAAAGGIPVGGSEHRRGPAVRHAEREGRAARTGLPPDRDRASDPGSRRARGSSRAGRAADTAPGLRPGPGAMTRLAALVVLLGLWLPGPGAAQQLHRVGPGDTLGSLSLHY